MIEYLYKLIYEYCPLVVKFYLCTNEQVFNKFNNIKFTDQIFSIYHFPKYGSTYLLDWYMTANNNKYFDNRDLIIWAFTINNTNILNHVNTKYDNIENYTIYELWSYAVKSATCEKSLIVLDWLYTKIKIYDTIVTLAIEHNNIDILDN